LVKDHDGDGNPVTY